MSTEAYAEAPARAADTTTATAADTGTGTAVQDAPKVVGGAVLPGVDLDDADTSFVPTEALREFAHRQRGEADDVAQAIAAGDDADPGAGVEVARRRRWAEIAETIAETALGSRPAPPPTTMEGPA
ncbi:hypothetical protein amrb99_14190 [Actinomadura sp. RB99]|uniref:hypothetical protein n=1 Tax=Actinomadura sp. RB99 TaxID=2691577 RepID=UPI001685D270|nr:hypothetical protein [Actinomadura sp. RB99]MBD2892509.1 hypothetical protein [Actinomadura sp. RB99]